MTEFLDLLRWVRPHRWRFYSAMLASFVSMGFRPGLSVAGGAPPRCLDPFNQDAADGCLAAVHRSGAVGPRRLSGNPGCAYVLLFLFV
jgi:hypothetical protein